MRLTLYSTFIDSKLNDNQWIYLKELKKYSDKLVILCNNTNINTSELSKITSLGINIQFFDNGGYDFGMFFNYFKYNFKDVEKYEKILFTNDSVLIIKPLIRLFKWLDNNKSEYIGIQDSIFHDGSWYIESWFLQLSGKAKGLIKEFLKDGYYINKFEVIKECEVKWSQEAKKRYKTDTYFSCKKYIKKEGVNLSYDNPVDMLEEGSWFVKKNFSNYGYSGKYKHLIEYLSSKIYLYEKMNKTQKRDKIIDK